jgi:hypothetical protein
LHNVVSDHAELFDVIEQLGRDGLRLTKENELMLMIPIMRKKKEYPLPLEKALMPAEDILRYENECLRKELRYVKA